ncbi:hypothetical protein DY000_02057139 [Brassica cretica]|uniref:GDSL esterase/lipase n=1 Tax=Brassica cretica TaxID=69181 RepID=A0ABQ7AHC1_BRACR|nr:hypothetical protein DY000_02057139 [Brassica cretica]
MATKACSPRRDMDVTIFLFSFLLTLTALVEAAGRGVSNNNNKNGGLGASFIFGDSLVDAGNNNYLPTLSRANMKPNGIDFKASGGNPTGRFTNGRTIGDIVGYAQSLRQSDGALFF